MIRLALLVTLVTVVGCAGGSKQKTEQRPVPQCLSLCSNQFAACTEEYPGDFSACRADRADCEQACEEQKALQRMDEEDDTEVIVPTDAEEDDEGMTPTPEVDEPIEGVSEDEDEGAE